MKRVLVLKDTNYGASKLSATANTALSPEQLAEGAIGIFGIPKTSANNKDKMALITDGGSDAAGKVPAASFDGDTIQIAIGTKDRHIISGLISVDATKVTRSFSDYAAPVKQVIDIGYLSTGKSFNLPSIVAKYDEFTFLVVDKNDDSFGGALVPQADNYTYIAKGGENVYDVVVSLEEIVNSDEDAIVEVTSIVSTLTGSAFANIATVSAVKGETSLTTSAAHGVGVNDYVSLEGDVYKAVAGTTGSTLVLDRPYRGATATIANVDALDLGATAPTDAGFKLTAKTAGKSYSISVQMSMENTDVTYTTAAFQGTGTFELISALEDLARGSLGTTDSMKRFVPYPDIKSISGTPYNIFTIKSEPKGRPLGEHGVGAFKSYDELLIAFVDGASGTAESDFGDALTSLGI